MSTVRRLDLARGRERGQALVEFSLAILVFVVMVVALFDVGRGVYTFNGVSEAAREIARRTVVHPGDRPRCEPGSAGGHCDPAGSRPGMGNPTFACVDVTGAASTDSPCRSGDYVWVTVTATYRPVALLGLGGPITLSSSSSMQIPP